ncbi:MAG: LPD23 domain-containing protein [Treponema sp.]|nr:LPD23 domain-containing protein [Treponema sp.]
MGRKSNDIIQGQSPAEEERNVALEETNQKEYSSDSITASIKSALVEKAEPLVTIDFTLENYNSLFPRGIVQTPIETVKLGENQFEKLDANNRNRFLLATYQTLAMPDIVIDENRNGSHSHNYIKSFIFDEKTKAVQDIVVSIDGENVSITAHPRDINNIVNKIKTPDQLVYAAAEVGRMIEQRTQYAQSIVNPTRVDRLSTISVPLNKEYSRETALSTIKEISEKTIFSKERNVALEETNIQGDKIMPEKENELYVSEEQALRIQLAREIKQNMPNLSDGERAAAIAILEAGASSQKMSLTDYVQQTFPNGVFGDYDRAQNAAHQQGVEINGAVSVSGFGANARAVIYASKTADFSTWCHELSHIWQAQLTGTLKDDAEKAFQVQDGNWQESIYTFADGHTDTSAEAFAYGFEDFLKHKAGEIATEDKKVIFEKFADYMSRTYNGIKQNIEVSEEIAKVYENFVQLDDNILAEAEKAVRMEKEFASAVILAESKPIEITHNHLQDITDLKELRTTAREEYKKLGSAITKDGRNVQFSTVGFKELKNHSAKRELLDVIPQLKYLTENAEYLFSESPEHFTKSDTLYFHNYGVKIKINDNEQLLRISVRETKNHDYFYDAQNTKVELIQKGLSSSNIDRSTNPADADKSLTKDKLYQWLKFVKENDVDNRISFQAAYHGSGASFDRFNTAQYGLSGEGSMSFGWGTYLTSSEDIAKHYAKGYLYSVEIPDGKFLEWDKKVPGITKTEISEKLYAHIVESDPEAYSGNAANYLKDELASLFESEMNGQHFYGTLADYLGSEKQASEFLKESGYTGISYPAGIINGNGNDATNYVIFNDDDITIKEHLQFHLVGERSIMRMTQNEERKRILEDLAAAKLMDEKYSNIEPSLKATRIRFATGWEKSADGQWKYELDDSLNRIKSGSLFEKILNTSPEMLEQLTKNTTLTLDDIMEAPELYGVFPFMKNVRVGFYSDPNAFRAVLTPDGIKINTKYLDGISGEKGMKGVLAHEIQHIIQAVEYSGSKGINGESIEQLYNNMMEAMKAASIKRYDYDVSSLEHGLSEYMHDSGEIEARNVARRIFMNASERRHTTLESTEDIARNMQFQIIGEQGAGKLDRNTESNERIANLDTAKENEKSLTKEAGKDYEALKQYQQKYPVSTLDVSSDVKEQLNIVFEQINSYFDNGISPKDGRFILPEVPEYMANTGSDKTPISLPVAVIKKARDVHQLNNDEIKNSILKLYDPIAVFESDKEKSENKANSKLILTDEFTNQSKPIVLAININSNIKISNGKKALEVQDIRSIHDRTLIANNGTDLIQKWTQDGLCRYVDEKKITEWSNVARVYFPIDELNSAENKILTKSELVNSHTEVEQRNVALETSEERNMTELKTYHTLKEEDVKNLEIISDEDFSNIVDSIILNDYKNIPNTIRLPNINSELAEKLGLEKDSAFIMKKSATHIRPDRKGSYNQALDTEEYRMIPKVMRDATFALVDKRVKNFQILFDDKNDIKKINKIVFNKDELGNYLVTIGKVGRQNSISEKENIVVGVGVAPTISDLRFPKGQPATRLRPSPTTVNSNIAQNKEMSTEKQTLPPHIKTLNSLIEQSIKEEKISAGKTQDDETKQKKQIPPNLTKKAASDFLRAVQEGTAPFFSMQNDDFGKITMTPQLIVNAQTGLPFKDETQLLAQIYSAEQDMNGQIVTSMEGAKEAGTYIKKCDEAMKNFVLVNQQHLSGENKVMPTRYFSPEAAENPDMVYANVLHKNRPAKIKSFRKLCLHFERIPEGQKDIQVILTKIAWEHLKELQRELKLPDGWKTENLTEKDIIEKKEYIKNYFEKVPARERTVFQETFGICTDVKKEYGDPAFSDKTRKIMDDKLTQFIKDNSFSAEYLAAFTKEEYDKLEDWKKEKGRQNKIEAVGIKEPEVYLGRYLAACNSHAEFITDAETIKVIKEKLSTKLKQNYRLEKYDILKEIGMQAGNICKETMKQNVFSKAHSHDKKQELSVQKDKQHPPVGMGAAK